MDVTIMANVLIQLVIAMYSMRVFFVETNVLLVFMDIVIKIKLPIMLVNARVNQDGKDLCVMSLCVILILILVKNHVREEEDVQVLARVNVINNIQGKCVINANKDIYYHHSVPRVCLVIPIQLQIVHVAIPRIIS